MTLFSRYRQSTFKRISKFPVHSEVAIVHVYCIVLLHRPLCWNLYQCNKLTIILPNKWMYKNYFTHKAYVPKAFYRCKISTFFEQMRGWGRVTKWTFKNFNAPEWALLHNSLCKRISSLNLSVQWEFWQNAHATCHCDLPSMWWLKKLRSKCIWSFLNLSCVQ